MSVELELANNNLTTCVARKTTGGRLYKSTFAGGKTTIIVPSTASGTEKYVAHGKYKQANGVTFYGMQTLDVGQADIVSRFTFPGGGSGVDLAISSEGPDIEVVARMLNPEEFIVQEHKGTTDFSGSVTFSVLDSSVITSGVARYLITARKRNTSDPKILDWVNHKVVEIDSSNVSLSIGSF